MIKKFDLYYECEYSEYFANSARESESGNWVRADAAENLYDCLKDVIEVLDGVSTDGYHIGDLLLMRDDLKCAIKVAEESV
jgi:hypothetical protein